MQDYEETVLFWLKASDTTQEGFREDIDCMREIFKDIRIFNDRDQCVETLPSIVDQTIFLVLGPGQSDLIDILSTFDYLEYIYLQERASYFPYPSQIRGVFPQTKQLFHQLAKDIKTAQNNHTHLHVSKGRELQQPQASTQNLQLRTFEFKWIQMLFDVLLNTTRPTEDIYQDLLDECRLIYRGNETQTGFIDEFEAEYEPSKAIWWYTRQTFLYQILNMALRTENMIIIWKFRYIIQDIYHQLKSRHENQKRENQNQYGLMVYRGQYISITELESLKKAEGGCIATTSFFSTTRNREVARRFIKNRAKPLNLEAVMFEISIEQTDQEEQRPFADIKEISYLEKEDEILFCMCTVMRVESVELVEGINRIRLRTCPSDGLTWQHSEVELLPSMSVKINDESHSLWKLGIFLHSMGECKKAQQFLKLIKSSSFLGKTFIYRMVLKLVRFGEKNPFDSDYCNTALMNIHNIQGFLQSPTNFESIPESLREVSKSIVQCAADALEAMMSMNMGTFDSSAYLQRFNERLERAPKVLGLIVSNAIPMPSIKPVASCLERAGSNDEQIKSEMGNNVTLDIDKTLTETDPSRPFAFLEAITASHTAGDYDRVLELAREGLSNRVSHPIRSVLHELLVCSYKMQGNWPALIESCQNIIDTPHLPPSSPSFVKAHITRGDAYRHCGNLSEALINYKNALQMQEQHHAPNHPLASEIYIKIGNILKTTGEVSTALEYYYKAISFNFPDTSVEAYQQIGIIYFRSRDYDLARSNLIKCLEIQQTWMHHQPFTLAWTYTWLIEVEHKSGYIDQRDLYIQLVRSIDLPEVNERELIAETLSEILAEIRLTSS